MKHVKAYIKRYNDLNNLFGCSDSNFCLPLSDTERKRLIERVECELSPENLTCDGELPAAAVRRRARELHAVLDELQ